jgi:hypothetical protein
MHTQGSHLVRRRLTLRQQLLDQLGLNIGQTRGYQPRIARPFHAAGQHILESRRDLWHNVPYTTGQQFHAGIQPPAGGPRHGASHLTAVTGNLQAQQ